MSNIPGFDDPVLIRLTHEDIRVIKKHDVADDEFLEALKKATPAEGGFLVGCRRECLIDLNCVIFAVSEDMKDKKEVEALLEVFYKIEPYEE
jgi:hypothetical protein